MQKVLIVEDNKGMTDMLTKTFRFEGFAVKSAYTIRDGMSLLSSDVSAVVTDLNLPDGNGMDILNAVSERFPFIPVVVITAYGSIEIAVKAVKKGAYDFITKPFDPDHLLLIIKRAIGEKSLKKENLILKREFSENLKMPKIIGNSKALNSVMEEMKKVSPLKTTVLILGESGTGKEIVARAIHHLSLRSRESFVAVNCAAIPKDLIENELFGHEKGAFTGADKVMPGRFELADGGTIFLDEIGDMAMPLQPRLLRVLEENEFERVGGTKTIKVDLRVIAASNRNLEKEVADKRFREDLFYRLNVFPIVIPPLRERKQDIMPLARHFISLFCKDMNKDEPSISQKVEDILLGYQWKGNIRELKNVIERAVILCDTSCLMSEHFNFNENLMRGKSNLDASLYEVAELAVRSAEKTKIESALRQAHGNKTKAAEILKVSYKTLFNKIKQYDIS